MKILILTTSFPLKEGIAVGIHVLEKARNLVRLGHEVTVLAPHHAGARKKELLDGIQVFRFSYCYPYSLQSLAYGSGIPSNLKRSFWAKVQLPFFLLSFFLHAWKHGKNMDVIHSHWSIAGLVGQWVAKRVKARSVLSMHGAEVFVLGRNRVLAHVLKHTDLIIFNSSFTERMTREHYSYRKGVVIHPGCDTDRFKVTPNPYLREQLGLEKDDVFLLSIGKFIPRKGFEYLIEAMDLLVNERKVNKVKLRIGGRGYLKPDLEKLIIKKGLEQHVSFLNYLEDEVIPTYFTEADIFILPSIVDQRGDTEGLGVVLVEAGACEIPVIASAVGGIPDVVVDGVNGLLVRQKDRADLAEKIATLSNDASLREKMGKKGREIALERFSWRDNSRLVQEAYMELLD